ncbi:unnamed protein product [Medioppia subpectinata]|uniref:Transmembrane protein 87A n=1 Tax=Medioppia subpectinata TaxID=1979941 RepID=A0A7R9PYU5_9ACAR|nr:unnamed protein product [Medioppia subpectinata]CAG2105504.1 unnamed protein product [Medioppia subpectinata]
MYTKSYVTVIVVIMTGMLWPVHTFPNQGKWSYTVSQRKCHFFEVNTALYQNSTISIKISCDSQEDKDMSVKIGWTIRETPCFEEYLGPELSPKTAFKTDAIGLNTSKTCSPPDRVCTSSPETTFLTLIGDSSEARTIDSAPKSVAKSEKKRSHLVEKLPTPLSRRRRDLNRMTSLPDYLKWYYYCPAILLGDFGYDRVHYLKTNEIEIKCNQLKTLSPKAVFKTDVIGLNTSKTCSPPDRVCTSSPETTFLTLIGDSSEARTIDSAPKSVTKSEKKRSHFVEELPTPLSRRRRDLNRMTSMSENEIIVPNDGVYLLIVYIESTDNNKLFNAEVDIEMKSKSGQHLSAIDWPLLPFYGVMCGVYVLFAFGWLFVSFTQWRDLLRIQFWIGAVIFLGMFEKAVFYAEYQSINSTGVSVKGAVLFAEILSCFKRTLARMLVIIVSCGFGIVKPRLGPILHRVVCVGSLYFILGSLEAVLRIYKPKNDPTNQTLMAGVPLAVLDSVICWWVFSSLVQTTRTLRLRRNVIKLNLYKQFTNTLIFAVLASIAFMIWQIHNHKLTQCLTDWKELWVDEAYWHLLFSAVLLVIMVLWRPTNNNQRYAFTPLLDASEDEDEDREQQIPHEAFVVIPLPPSGVHLTGQYPDFNDGQRAAGAHRLRRGDNEYQIGNE